MARQRRRATGRAAGAAARARSRRDALHARPAGRTAASAAAGRTGRHALDLTQTAPAAENNDLERRATRGDWNAVPDAITQRRHERRAGFCTALYSGGVALSLACVLAELSFQIDPAASTFAAASAACAAGALIGLWLPAWLIRRKSRRAASPETDETSAREVAPFDADFAATVAASVLILAGVAWAGLCTAALFLEDLRRALATRCLAPALVQLGILQTAALTGLAFAALTATVALSALNGWHRAVVAPARTTTGPWRALLFGIAAGGVAAAALPTPAYRVAIALPCLFAAALVANRRDAPTGDAPSNSTVGREPLSSPRLPLLGAALISFVAAGAIAMTLTAAPRGLPELGRMIAITGFAGCVGLAVARGRAAGLRGSGAVLTPAVSIAGVAALWLTAESTTATLRAGVQILVVAASVASIALIGRAAAHRVASTQRALAVLGSAVALGVAGAFATTAFFALRPPRASAAQTEPRADTLAGVVHSATRARSLAPGAAGLWGPSAQSALPDTGDAWRIDLCGPRHDLLWIDVDPSAFEPRAVGRDDLRRVLRRCSTAMMRRGRLVLNLPDGDTFAARAVNLLTGSERERARLIRARRGAESAALLVLGSGVDAWWANLVLPDGVAAAIGGVEEVGARAAGTDP